jgi:hypothetical protein
VDKGLIINLKSLISRVTVTRARKYAARWFVKFSLKNLKAWKTGWFI